MSVEAPVSVIIVNYNGGSLLRRCLETLGDQTVSPQEILIVDNGSMDGSLTGLEDLPVVARGRVRIFPRVPTWASPPPTTWPRARPRHPGSPP